MTKRRKDTDYLFLSARIRAMERRLLTAQRLEQLLTAPSVEACAQLLSEWGYAPVHDEPSLQAALSAQREAVFADVSRFMPEAEVLDVFRLKYDYHNIKTLLKAPQDAERLLIDAGTVSAETMRKKHAENGGWDFLPADMAAAADEAQRVLAETGSARSSDCILDRAYFARLEKLARNGGKLPARAVRFDAPPAPGEAVRIYLSEAFWGIACLREDQLVWRAQIPPET